MIEVLNLTKSFGEKIVLKDFSACFQKGLNCLMGDSGVGKTTLVNIMLGFFEPDSGEIRGIENKRINCVFQENRLIEPLSAVKNVMLVCESTKKDEAVTLLCEIGLKGCVHSPVSTLSGGMKRRVAIARALISPADIYIFDEPFSGLDDSCKNIVIETIMKRTKGAIVIFITHDVFDVDALKCKVIRMPS